MRKLGLLATLVVASAFFLGATALPASAANCSPVMDATYYQSGYLKSGTNVTNCTGVDQVQFKRAINTWQDFTGWTDLSGGNFNCPGPCTPLPAPANLNLDVQTNGRVGVNLPSTVGPIWKITPWCGGAVRYIFTSMIWRIHNMATGTWGTWIRTQTQNYPIVC